MLGLCQEREKKTKTEEGKDDTQQKKGKVQLCLYHSPRGGYVVCLRGDLSGGGGEGVWPRVKNAKSSQKTKFKKTVDRGIPKKKGRAMVCIQINRHRSI